MEFYYNKIFAYAFLVRRRKLGQRLTSLQSRKSMIEVNHSLQALLSAGKKEATRCLLKVGHKGISFKAFRESVWFYLCLFPEGSQRIDLSFCCWISLWLINVWYSESSLLMESKLSLDWSEDPFYLLRLRDGPFAVVKANAEPLPA